MSKESENSKSISDQNSKIQNSINSSAIQEIENPVDNNLKSDDEISMKEFLEFLKSACQIHDIIFFGESKFFGEINLNEIANDRMINKILGETIKERVNELTAIYDNQLEKATTATASTLSNQANRIETTATSLLRKRSIPGVNGNLNKNNQNKIKLETAASIALKTNLITGKSIHPVLKKKLDEFIDEGIIDSVLPHICPAHHQNTTTYYPLINMTTNPLLNGNVLTTINCNNNNTNTGNNVNTNNNNVNNISNNNINNNNNVSSNNNTNSNNTQNGNKVGSKMASKLKEGNSNNKDNGKLGHFQQRNTLHRSVDIVDADKGIVEGTNIKNNSAVDKIKPPKTADTVYKVKENKTTLRRKSLASGLGSRESHENKKNGESEVVIHVCDEVKSTSKDFSCPQNLLVNKMRYFADVTGGQKLEDMDISVHCDIQIFEWLMRWVKKDMQQSAADGNNNAPQLDASNVIPILVSASFLQMEPLLLDCLSFCHSRLNDVVRTSTNLSCLNDAIITRLAAMFTNLELEMVKDKKDRVTPRLWTKLIQSLMEPEPQALRGHYYSLGGLYRCQKCGKYLTQASASYISCTASNVRINRWGQLVSQHVKDPQWDINQYVLAMYKELKSWRKVYWKLWGHCHFLYCCICETHFPVFQMNWCLYHPEPAQFLGPITESHAPGPAGRFPCCGQQAFRFESLIGPNGCQFREHSVLVETDRDRAVLALAQIAAEGGCLTESPKIRPVSQYGTSSDPIWTGISLMPTKCRQGLLPNVHLEDNNYKFARRGKQQITYAESSSDSDTSDSFPTAKGKFPTRQLSGSTDGCESESSSERNYKSNRRRTARCSKSYGRYWCGEVSARSNQDNQREFEEKVMKQIISIVSKKNGNENCSTTLNTGGSYVRLEAEWKEQIKQKSLGKAKSKF